MIYLVHSVLTDNGKKSLQIQLNQKLQGLIRVNNNIFKIMESSYKEKY